MVIVVFGFVQSFLLKKTFDKVLSKSIANNMFLTSNKEYKSIKLIF